VGQWEVDRKDGAMRLLGLYYWLKKCDKWTVDNDFDVSAALDWWRGRPFFSCPRDWGKENN
jgi:hypothetical protein